ncbi:MAG: hypothetical protein QXY49_04705 [Thermofilaceae archaeon]
MQVEKIAFALILTGFALVVLTVIYLASTGSVRGIVGCIFIPIPICIGAGELAPSFFVIATLLTLILIIITFLLWRIWIKELREHSKTNAIDDA